MANPQFTNKKYLRIAEESTPGIAGDINASVAIELEDLSVTKMKTTEVQRKTIKPYFGSNAKIITQTEAQVTLSFALAVGGNADGVPVAGTVPQYDMLLQSCNMSSIVTSSDTTGTAQGGSLNTIILASGASATDDAYSGHAIYVQVAAGTAQAPGSTDKNIIKLASGASAVDDYYNGYFCRVKHFAGTIVDTAGSDSTNTIIYLPSGTVGSSSLLGMDIEITTGSAQAEVKRIKAYNTTTKRAVLDSALATAPDNTSTFVVSQSKLVSAYNGTTKVATLASNLGVVTTTSTTYELAELRHIQDYDGTSKTAIVYPALTKAATNSVTYIVGKSVEYYPNSNTNTQKSYTIWYNEDGALHQFVYAKGTVSFDFTSGQIPMAKAVLTGLIENYDVDTIPTVDLAAWVKPLPVNYANTKTIVIHGFDQAVLDKISFDLGNTVIHRNMPNADRVLITGREAKGQVTFETVLKTDYDFYAAVENADVAKVMFMHGPVGQQVGFYCPSVQLSNPSDSDKDGIAMMQLDMTLPALNGGNNEMVLILQ